jgi:heptosyltransferase-2
LGTNGEKVKKILIRGPNWIGDSVISIPVIKAVRQNYPESYIGLVLRAGPAELLQALPYADKIYIEDRDDKVITGEKFDLGIILPNSFSSALKFWRWGVKERVGYPSEHRGIFLTKKVPAANKPRSAHLAEEYFQILRTAGMKIIETKPEFFIPRQNLRKAEEILKKCNFTKINKITGICPGAAYGPAKIWPKERFLNIINRLIKEKDSNIIVFAGPKEQETVNFLLQNTKYRVSIIICPADDIMTSAALMKECGLFITNDTGPMHIAAALGVPTIAIFGSTNPVWTAPLGEKTKVIYKHLDCSPCYSRVCKKNKMYYECLTKIAEEDVFTEIEKLKIF